MSLDGSNMLIAKIRENIIKGRKISFVSGNFNIIHTGHLRLFKFAREISDYLVVFVGQDNEPGVFVKREHRVEGLKALSIVDFVLDINSSVEDVIRQLEPDCVVKGSEFHKEFNPELDIVNSYGGKLIFCSGEVVYSSYDLFREKFYKKNESLLNNDYKYIERHNIKFNTLSKYINNFKNLKILVIGDIIVDEYINCEPIGMSQEDPTIVVTPIETNTFIGGASVVAAHARGLGANVSFCSVAGNDDTVKYVRKTLINLDIEHDILLDETRPTTRKQRFRANGKTLLRVNHLRQHVICDDHIKLLKHNILKHMNNIDLLLFSDFNYGCLPQSIVDYATLEAGRRGILVVADSQASSQLSDISRFKGMDLVTPTEREARLAVQDNESGVAYLSELLRKRSGAKNIFITLASEGVLINGIIEGNSVTDRLPALSKNSKDTAGAGDSLFTTASMALVLGANIWESAYIGSIAAACQVSRVGNQQLSLDDLLNELNVDN